MTLASAQDHTHDPHPNFAKSVEHLFETETLVTARADIGGRVFHVGRGAPLQVFPADKRGGAARGRSHAKRV